MGGFLSCTVGDPEKPTLVFFFDEAHLLFDDAPKALQEKIEQVVRLIRSKGVSVFFVTQNPKDVPEDVLAQLGLKVQHALRAFTAKDRKAIKLAAEKSNWGKSSNGVYQGFAAYYSHNTHVAEVIDLTIQNGQPKIEKVTVAVDCGIVVNPTGAKNQVEGGVIDGIGHAMYGDFTFQNGQPGAERGGGDCHPAGPRLLH